MEAFLNGPQGRIPLGVMPVILGSDPQSQVVITDEQVAPNHAQIVANPDGTGYTIVDQQSASGTFVNANRLIANVSHPLQPGDTVRVGNSLFVFETGAAMAPPPPTSYGNIPPHIYQQASQAGAPTYPPVVRGQNQKVTIGIAVGLVVVVGIVIFAAMFSNRSTPQKTLEIFCSSMVQSNAQALYDILDTESQQETSVQEIQQFMGLITAFGGISSCTFSNIVETYPTATAYVTFESSTGDPDTDTVRLINEGGTWKLDGREDSLFS